MPNTLAHLGVQALATRALIPKADPKWIYLGCILPDIPWMFQRLVKYGFPQINPYDLKLYAIVQASLFFSLLLCLALSFLSHHFLKSFSILSLNVLLHLFLDGLQIKWGNGVHFLAPFDWRALNFGLFWPESLPAYLLTGAGALGVLWLLKPAVCLSPDLKCSWKRLGLGSLLVLAYMAAPLFLLDGPGKADSYFVDTLQDRQTRVGKYIAFDRNDYRKQPKGGVLVTFAGEALALEQMPPMQSGQVSLRGIFSDHGTIRVTAFHRHFKHYRDGASVIGLLAILGLWIAAVVPRGGQRGRS